MQTYPPSRYQPIWDQLKAEGKCCIVAHTCLHKRIKKAVIKRKDEDLAFKLLLSEQYKYARLSVSISGNSISFKLEYRTNLSQLTVGAL